MRYPGIPLRIAAELDTLQTELQQVLQRITKLEAAVTATKRPQAKAKKRRK